MTIRTASARVCFTIRTTNAFRHMTNLTANTWVIIAYSATSTIGKMTGRTTGTRIFMPCFTTAAFF